MKEEHNSETLEQTRARHTRHQDMLRQHRDAKHARQTRARKGYHSAYKQDSEMLGFKSLLVPKVKAYRAY